MGEVAQVDAITEKLTEDETDLVSALRNIEGLQPPAVVVMPRGGFVS